MLRNYITITLRTLKRNKGYAIINIGGLAVGLACCILIALYVRHELSYDDFHAKAARMYRVVEYSRMGAESRGDLIHSAQLAPALEREFPGVINAVRLSYRLGTDVLVRRGEDAFYEDGFYFVDSTFFDVFSFPLIRGNPQTALQQPFGVVLTQEAAKRYFGSENPVGQTIRAQGYGRMHELTITGVAADPPSNSHFQFDALVSHSTLRHTMPSPEHLDSWNYTAHYTYVLLEEGFTPEEFQVSLDPFLAKYRERTYQAVQQVDNAEFGYRLQPITDIHLYSHYDRELASNSDVRYVYIFGLLALLILIVACINYVNLATARSAHGAREVGMRKVVGAHRVQLIRQFLGESALVCLVAVLAALVLVQLFLPLFNGLTGLSLHVDAGAWGYWAGVIGLGGFLALLAGSYPAFYLSSFRPVRVLKGLGKVGPSGARLRKGLVVFQFAAAIALIAGAFLIQRQLQHMQNMRLGFDQEHVVVVHARDALSGSYETFEQRLLQHTDMVGVTASNVLIPTKENIEDYLVPEGLDREVWRAEADITINGIAVDADFPQVMDIPVVEGRGFRDDFESEAVTPVLINQTAARALGWEEPIGKTFPCCFRPTPRVIGVVSDFHYQSFKQEIQPLVIRAGTYAPFVMVHVRSNGLPTALDYIQEQWAEVSDVPFEYSFLDQRFDELYRAERRFGRVFGIFAGLAILIACLGLFGVAAFAVERRTKEIGIRKVLGASVPNLVGLLSKDFLKLVLVAFLIAVPIAYVAMQKWLEDFAYRVELGPWLFIGAGMLAVIIALVTVGYQAMRAALADPVEALHLE